MIMPKASSVPATQPSGDDMASPAAKGPGWEAKRMEILRASARIFADQGFKETSVNELSERLGVSKPVLYYYAKNKEDILFQIWQISREQLGLAISRAQKSQLSGIGKLKRFFGTYTEIMCSDFGRCFVLVNRNSLSPEALDNDTAGRRQMEAAVRDMIAEGQEDGSIARCNPALAARALFGAFNNIPSWFHEGGEFDASDVAGAYMDIFITGLGRG
jgi:AcrR family transcriptional regulator